jgi:hypothetical protein
MKFSIEYKQTQTLSPWEVQSHRGQLGGVIGKQDEVKTLILEK